MKLVQYWPETRGAGRFPDTGFTVGEDTYSIWAILKLGGFDRHPSHRIEAELCASYASGRLAELTMLLATPPESAEWSLWRQPAAGLVLDKPLTPISFRDFYAFEQHVRTARGRRGLEMIAEWYEAPAFYFSNTASIMGPDSPIQKPPETNQLDYELELGVVIGKEGADIPVEEADSYIAGFTIINDWSARDIQRREMKVGLGPAKGKDFATSIGPYLVTPDELEDRILSDPKGIGTGRSRGNRYDLTMTARVNGREYSRGNAKDMHWTFAELISHASRNTVIQPGDLFGSGTVGTGCILEILDEEHPWIQPGDVVELEIEKLGILRNQVIE